MLCILQQELNLYQIYQQQIAECDTALAAHLQTLDDKAEPGSPLPPAKANKKAGSNAPSSFDLRGELYRISGTDLTQIDGIKVMTAQTIIAESPIAEGAHATPNCWSNSLCAGQPAS